MLTVDLNNPNSVFYKNYRRQLAATLTVNLLAFSHGIGLGWAAPMLLILQSPDTPLTFSVSVQEASWIGAIISFGGLTGNILFGVMLDIIGRKKCLYLLAVPHILFWCMIFSASDVRYLYIARMLGGTTGGGTYTLIPIFVAEIADSKVRGTLGAVFCFALNTGMLVGNIFASHIPYIIIPCFVIVLPILFLIFVFKFPETPQFLLRQGYNDDAEKSLKYYQMINNSNKEQLQQFDNDFNEMKTLILSSNTKNSISWGDICAKRSVKGLFIGLILMFVHQFTGTFTVMTYSSLIFAESKSSMDPNTNTIIIGAFQIVGAYCAFILIDNFGRKFLLIVSTVGMCLGYTLMGVHSYMMTYHSFDGARWLPVVLMSLIILSANIGIVSVTFIILVEILPPKIRAFGTTACLVLSSLLCFVVLKVFPVSMLIFGLWGVMWMFAVTAGAGFLFILIAIVETKGKNVNDESAYD